MSRYILLLFTSLMVFSNCSSVDSDSDQNTIKGTVTNASGVPIQNIEIHAVYIADTPTSSTSSTSINIYPNPFKNSTTIPINITEQTMQYVLKVENLETMEEVEIFNEVLGIGEHRLQWYPEANNLSNGIYRLTDNRGGYADLFFAPSLTTMIGFNNVNQPRTAGNVSGYLIGQTVATTNNDGKFSFEKDKLILIDESYTLIRRDETGLELARFSLSSNVNIVAHIDGNRYAFKEIDLKQNLSLIHI